MPEFYIIIARKYFSRILGGHVSPVSYAYVEPSRLKTQKLAVTFGADADQWSSTHISWKSNLHFSLNHNKRDERIYIND